MAGAVLGDLPRDAISGGCHLGSHVHLTNFIHVHHHVHRRSPNPNPAAAAERSLMCDLLALQRSRSLRDPPASPPAWPSPSVVAALVKRRALDAARRSADGRREVTGISSTSQVAATGASGDDNAEGGESAEASGESLESDASSYGDPPPDSAQWNSPAVHNVGLQTLSEQSVGVPDHGTEKIFEQHKVGISVLPNGLGRGKRGRFKRVRRNRCSVDFKAAAVRSVLSVNSSSQEATCQKRNSGAKQEKDTELGASQASRNVCGIPCHWSGIHHRNESFQDKAGRSLYCGLSDSRARKDEGVAPQNLGNLSKLPITSTSSDFDVLSLLVDSSGTQNSSGNHSGELGIYSNQSLEYEQDRDSDLLLEARPGQKSKNRHKSLTQKYTPRTFEDIVGHKLVMQALSSAVLKKKIGTVYVFYGPHGTGKTSCARIFAKALNCRSAEHPKPCNSCASCISHDLGNSRDVLEVAQACNINFEGIMGIIDNVMLSKLSSQYRVFIFDDCDTLPTNTWSVILKVMDRAPRHVVFVLVSSHLKLPRTIMYRCQKFFFPKLKESDIVSTLQWISNSEGLEVDEDALKLIASQSDGSLRDAEMTLDQLSLLGQRISLSLVQQLIGLVSDEELVDLLDLALSADTVNTVKTLRKIMATGVDPLALTSQIATLITDIFAGSYVFTQERLHRKFFHHPTLSKEDMENLRQALKTLSEADKQLRVSNVKMTWLTAALLQLAPDKQYISYRNNMLPKSSKESSLSQGSQAPKLEPQKCSKFGDNKMACRSNTIVSSRCGGHTPESLMLSTGATGAASRYSCGKIDTDIERIWQIVLKNVQSDMLRKILAKEGRLSSISLGAAPTVQLVLTSHEDDLSIENFRGHILQAFESVLSCAVILEIRYESKNDMSKGGQAPLTLAFSGGSLGGKNYIKRFPEYKFIKGSEIIETELSPHFHGYNEQMENGTGYDIKGKGCVWADKNLLSENQENKVPLSGRKGNEDRHRQRSLVRGKISLAHVINKAQSCSQQSQSRRKSVSIAEKLEQENLRLEPRSRSLLLCWKASRMTRGQLVNLRITAARSRSLAKDVICGRCTSTRSPK